MALAVPFFDLALAFSPSFRRPLTPEHPQWPSIHYQHCRDTLQGMTAIKVILQDAPHPSGFEHAQQLHEAHCSRFTIAVDAALAKERAPVTPMGCAKYYEYKLEGAVSDVFATTCGPKSSKDVRQSCIRMFSQNIRYEAEHRGMSTADGLYTSKLTEEEKEEVEQTWAFENVAAAVENHDCNVLVRQGAFTPHPKEIDSVNCHPAASTVEGPDGPARIDELAVGDLVRARTSFEPVIAIPEAAAAVAGRYLQIQTVAGRTLNIAPHHHLYVNGSEVDSLDARVGDLLTTPFGDEAVESVRVVFLPGAYHIITPSGTYFVDGLLASDFVSTDQCYLPRHAWPFIKAYARLRYHAGIPARPFRDGQALWLFHTLKRWQLGDILGSASAVLPAVWIPTAIITELIESVGISLGFETTHGASAPPLWLLSSVVATIAGLLMLASPARGKRPGLLTKQV